MRGHGRDEETCCDKHFMGRAWTDDTDGLGFTRLRALNQITLAIRGHAVTDDWSVSEFLDRASGKVYRRYTYKRKPCIRVVLNSRLSQQLAGWTLIEKDLRNVAVWLKEIESRHKEAPKRKGESFGIGRDRETYNLIKGLFVAALTFYGKCFSKCEGRPVKLERAQLEERYRVLHDECISYRHNFAAHSGAAKIESVEIAVVLPEKFRSSVSPRIYHELSQPDLAWPSGDDEVSFQKLVEHARDIAGAKITRLSDKILHEEVLPKGYDYWRKL